MILRSAVSGMRYAAKNFLFYLTAHRKPHAKIILAIIINNFELDYNKESNT